MAAAHHISLAIRGQDDAWAQFWTELKAFAAQVLEINTMWLLVDPFILPTIEWKVILYI